MRHTDLGRLRKLAEAGDRSAAEALGKLAQRRGFDRAWGQGFGSRDALYRGAEAGMHIVARLLRDGWRPETAWLPLYETRWDALGTACAFAALERSEPARHLAAILETNEHLGGVLDACAWDAFTATDRALVAALAARFTRLGDALRRVSAGPARDEVAGLCELAESHARVASVLERVLAADFAALTELDINLWAPHANWRPNSAAYRRQWPPPVLETPTDALAIHCIVEASPAANRWGHYRREWSALSAQLGERIRYWRLVEVKEAWLRSLRARSSPHLSLASYWWEEHAGMPASIFESAEIDALVAAMLRELDAYGVWESV